MSSSPSTSNTKKVLLVEDDQELLLSLDLLLQRRNYQTRALHSTKQIWQVIDQFDPDCLVLDVYVKPISGVEVAQQLEQRPESDRLSLVLISAIDNLEQLAQEAGVTQYLDKPFACEELVEMIEA